MRETSVFTHAVEDYLKVIYELTSCGERAATTQIAERMGVAPASATGMVQKMAAASPPLLVYQKHHGVELTPAGRQMALEIIRHHRLIETYLAQVLGYSWDQVHAEADRLEHVISEEFEARIALALGDPSHDPHGEPIPGPDLRLPAESPVRLAELRPGQQAIVQRVGDTRPEFLRYLEGIGLTPKAQVAVLDYSPFDENLSVRIAGQAQPHVLGLRVTGQVFVEVV